MIYNFVAMGVLVWNIYIYIIFLSINNIFVEKLIIILVSKNWDGICSEHSQANVQTFNVYILHKFAEFSLHFVEWHF